MALLGRLLKNKRAGESSLAWHREGLDASDSIIVTSDAFDDGGAMPRRTAGAGVGENVSPALAWSGVPEQTVQLVLIVEDPDVPFRTPIAHAVAADLDPASSGVAEGALNAGRAHGTGRGAFGRVGYNGPRPIPGHGPHAYVFQLFALDTTIELDEKTTPAAVIDRMRDHVIARGRLTGTYER